MWKGYICSCCSKPIRDEERASYAGAEVATKGPALPICGDCADSIELDCTEAMAEGNGFPIHYTKEAS